MGEVFAARYELADPIGRGGVGAVWRAWDHRRRRYVAAKVLQQSDAHALLRFVREQALRIDHPHVLAPASWAADDDKVLFTMDLVAGGSLAHLVGDYGPLPPVFVCTLLDQLLSGLAAVHAEGVVHRDIKPANILLEATGTARPRLRLSDFGIAMRLGEPRLTDTDLVVGTPGYLAPEQMLGADPDFPADLFAVGLVALYLLEGAKPDAKALVEYFADHGTPGAPKNVPEPLWQVVATLLQPDPQARFRTATGARKALAAAAELLPEPGPDDELIEIFDQLGPLPKGFGPDGPAPRSDGSTTRPENPASRTAGPPDTARPNAASAPSRPSTPPAQAPPRPAAPPPGPTHLPGPPHVPGHPSHVPGHPSHVPGHPSHVPGSAAAAGPASEPTPTPSHAPSHPPSMSDTGSFPLPPPQPTTGSFPSAPASDQASAQSPGPRPPGHTPPPVSPASAYHQPSYRPAYRPTHQPAHQPAYETTFALPTREPRADTSSTVSYTARDSRTPQHPQHVEHPHHTQHAPAVQAASPQTGRRGHRAARRGRPGPPMQVAVPLLLLALACYAVGFWALARI
ncbi:serine/threonine-protein kinase [Streptomyces sp. NBC_00199]|uniref:serine/threonine-protein kinase n=1 Tax=Streptomyces sp. NBC_00199 TaxID=2975678 RepID=UPI002250A6E2|nr:serine/threonine protein kinase [Streptomyces sp. NBC_00199]MCX5266232.1 protein kinase [Streptomyces sp. NBC_00199]